MNYKEIRDLIELIRDTDVAEIEVERAGTRIRLRREKKEAGAFQVREVAVAPQTRPQEEVQVPAREDQPAENLVKSPLVGTFYRAPDPNSKAFVEVGDHVVKGQVLCIVEAMKLMNEIEAEFPGTVAEILIQDGQPVEYGQPLFRIEPDA
jgi:acetyl-CoA carboxylase biotin carboxyl carrier protein